MTTINIPKEDWEKMQELTERIMRRSWEQEEDTNNLNNLLHALHGEGVRDRKYTKSHNPEVFVDGEWVDRG